MNHYYYDRPDLAGEAPARPERQQRPRVRRRRSARPARRPGMGRAAACLCAFLLLMAGGSAGALALRQLSPAYGWENPGAGDPWEDWTASVLPVPTETVERAPVGDGTTLTLLPEPEGEALSLQAIYQKCLPSIVSIQTTTASGSAQGTGIVMTETGYIITNHHVIEGAQALSVTPVGTGEALEAKLVGSDAASDLAVLKVEAQLTPAQFGDSALLEVGDLALALGNPLGEQFSGTMTDGISSFIVRSVLVDGFEMQLIQTSAALNSGNSGGALLNEYGQVVGVTTLKMSSDWNTIEALGFAVPTATVKGVVDQLLATGYVTGRPTIGITVVEVGSLSGALAEGLPRAGLYVAEVDEGSDAWAKGVRPGDVITVANGERVYTADGLNELKNALSVGDALELEIFREGETFTVSVELADQFTLG